MGQRTAQVQRAAEHLKHDSRKRSKLRAAAVIACVRIARACRRDLGPGCTNPNMLLARYVHDIVPDVVKIIGVAENNEAEVMLRKIVVKRYHAHRLMLYAGTGANDVVVRLAFLRAIVELVYGSNVRVANILIEGAPGALVRQSGSIHIWMNIAVGVSVKVVDVHCVGLVFGLVRSGELHAYMSGLLDAIIVGARQIVPFK